MSSSLLRKPPAENWKDALSDASYLHRRLSPSLGDIDYLPFQDLKSVVKHFSNLAHGIVFDYGCGGSPYQQFFAHCSRYIRADIVSGPNVDVVLEADGGTKEPENSMDVVFSSQVLEHVADPAAYLREACRILRPNGILILTTHGMFLEHGCPEDYYRWTGFGLEKVVRAAGFEVEETVKITTGVRAAAHLIHTAFAVSRVHHSFILRLLMAVVRRSYALGLRWIINQTACWLEPRSCTPTSDPVPIYIGVGVLARKPARPACESHS